MIKFHCLYPFLSACFPFKIYHLIIVRRNKKVDMEQMKFPFIPYSFL